MAVLWKLLYQPLKTLMAERAQRIAQGLDYSKEMESAKNAWTQTEAQMLNRAQTETQKIITAAQARAKEIESEARADAQKQIQDLVEMGKQTILRQQKQAEEELETKITNLVSIVAEKFLEKKVTAESDEQLIKKIFKSVWTNRR